MCSELASEKLCFEFTKTDIKVFKNVVKYFFKENISNIFIIAG